MNEVIKVEKKDIEKIDRFLSKQANYKTSTGYTGNKKTIAEQKKAKKEKRPVSAKQRKTDHLSRKQKATYGKLQFELDNWFQKHSKVSRKEPGKETKKDVQKGLKAPGVWSINTYKNYMKKSKTFLKYCITEYQIKSMRDIKPGMVVSFIEKHIAQNSSPKTIGGYMSSIKKMGEFGANEGLKSFKKLASARAEELVPEYSSDEYRRGKKGGYSIKDVQVLAKKAEENFSLLHRTAIEVLGFSGPRMDEFLKIKWKHIDFEKKRIYLTDTNMTKGNRPRFLPVNEKTMKSLKEIYDLGLHKADDERIWGSRMNDNDVRHFVKECAKLGRTKYSSIHDFRRSTVQYTMKQMSKEFKNSKANPNPLTKEGLVDRILEQVGVDPRLNPLVEKKILQKDAAGKVMYKTLKNGKRIPLFEKMKDKYGNPVKDHKYIKEDLMNRRVDYLKNLYLSQILGHSRTSVTSIYKK